MVRKASVSQYHLSLSIGLGTSLVSLGKAHCQAATLQEAFALHFEETYLASLKRTEDEIREYQNQRKKLDSRRFVTVLCGLSFSDYQAD